MRTYKFAEYEIEIDYARTLEYYKDLPFIGDEDDCNCIYCQNYALATMYFPEDVKSLCINIGVNLKKDARVSHFYEAKNSKHMYIAEYKLFGNIIRRAKTEAIDVLYKNDEDYFTISLLNVEVDDNVIELCIEAFLPWLLDIPPE
ncbi:hypothetical protein VQL36_18595 [Chengkuizengella sp. SCS-71B]|uniref:hypothetical protein n=1 Tax=Chengkuizengella sp. SCS-71B TaxID=3115290 RepID=UPI0032C20D59